MPGWQDTFDFAGVFPNMFQELQVAAVLNHNGKHTQQLRQSIID